MSELFNKIAKDVGEAHGIEPKKQMRSIEIDLTYDDIESVLSDVVHKNEIVEWVFPTNDGEDILIKFVQHKDEEA
jgi:hypothetical protein